MVEVRAFRRNFALKSRVLSRAVAPLLLLAVACGYSEDEWQAQLAKYEQLNRQHQSEKQAHDQTRAELAKTMGQVATLKKELEGMGVNMEALNQKLEQTGSQNKELSQNLADMTRALEEYKARAAQLEKIKQRFELLRDKLKKLTETGLKVEIRRNRLVIRLPGDVLFASGDDKLSKAGHAVLNQVAEVIRNDKQLSARYFQIAGHTDNKPLLGGRFGDNWGLSTMRARSVLVYLIAPTAGKEGGGGLSAEKLHAAGYGETDPVIANSDDKSRQQNRRVELVLMPDVEEMLDLKSLI
jgi:chemotaxis protein MotB